MKLLCAIALLGGLLVPVSAHADSLFSYTITAGGGAYSVSGTLTGSLYSPNIYSVSNMTGSFSVDGDPAAITSVLPLNGFDGNDNLLYLNGGPYFDYFGLGFTVNVDGTTEYANLYENGMYLADYSSIPGNGFTPSTYYGIDSISITEIPSSVPEPSSIALLGTALFAVAGTLRRRFVA